MNRKLEDVIFDIERCTCYVPDACRDCSKLFNGTQCMEELLTDALALLKEQEPKAGHWTVLKNCSNSGVYCSECQTKIFEYTTPPKKKLSQFCPHCGAKMAPWDRAVRL